MITLTEKAANSIKEVIGSKIKGEENLYLQVGVKVGGCAGMTYEMDITNNLPENYESFESEGITIICDPKSLKFLDGTEIDFQDGLIQKGFVFNNPRATGCCCCKQGFSCTGMEKNSENICKN